MKQFQFVNNFYLQVFLSLRAYCETHNFSGWDPFDGLNSKIFQASPIKYSSLARLAWLQLFKHSPINLRNLLLVPKDHNPKAIALFITGFCNLYKIQKTVGDEFFCGQKEIHEKIIYLSNLLLNLRSKGYSGACWGYNFDWQNRVFFQPKYTPTVVVTSFCADALFKAYEITGQKGLLTAAISSGNFIERDLNRTESPSDNLIFSYSPLDNSKVYNASLLGARLLAQCNYYHSNENHLNLCIRATNTITGKQSENGSWRYGEHKVQSWIDSFHTGYNLECIYEIRKYTGNSSFNDSFEKGLNYYLANFFLADGTPKYFNDKTHPVDIHSAAQFIVTMGRTGCLHHNEKLVNKVLSWTINNMFSKKGFFHYQRKQFITLKTPYMRWSQAWMFYAFSYYFKLLENENMD
jgi:hypothetical protein